MKRSFLFLLSACAIVMFGCNGAVIIGAPEMTAVIMDADGVTIFWEKNDEIEGSSEFAGYNVYAYTDSSALLNTSGEDLNKFNGQVVRDTVFNVNGLSQDSIYYIQVRTVNIDDKVGGYNDETPFLTASPRPEFLVTMYLRSISSGPADSCAIRYRDALIIADSSMIDSSADAWGKSSGDTVWIESPSTHPLYGSGARQTVFVNIGAGDFDSIAVVTAEPTMSDAEVADGAIVIAKTEDGNYVKMRVEAIDTIIGTITILYAYQNIIGFPYF